MKQESTQKVMNGKKVYKSPTAEVAVFCCEDILIVSGKDENQGEWDMNQLFNQFNY